MSASIHEAGRQARLFKLRTFALSLLEFIYVEGGVHVVPQSLHDPSLQWHRQQHSRSVHSPL